MPGAAVQLLAQDYAALKQSAKFAALYREMQKSHPEVAMSLQSQFRDAIGAPAPEVSPRTLAALAVPVMMNVKQAGNRDEVTTDFYSPSGSPA